MTTVIWVAFCTPEFARCLDGLAERPGVGLRLEDVGDEGVLGGVHDERHVGHVFADAEERQEPGEEGRVIKAMPDLV